MPKKRVLQIASASKNSAQYAINAPHFTEWWKKTAIKNVLKYAPKATELEKLERLSRLDDHAEGFDSETGEILENGDLPAAKPKGTRAARAVKAAAGTKPDPKPEGGQDNSGAVDAEFEEVDHDEGAGDNGDQHYEEDEIPM